MGGLCPLKTLSEFVEWTCESPGLCVGGGWLKEVKKRGFGLAGVDVVVVVCFGSVKSEEVHLLAGISQLREPVWKMQVAAFLSGMEWVKMQVSKGVLQ